MKRMLVTFAAVLAWIAVASASNQTQCPTFGASNVIISVSTKRNSSGHWNIAVDVKNEAQRLSVNNHDHGGVALTLGQTSSFCNNTDSVHLFASATVSTPTPPPGYEFVMGLGYYRFSPLALTWLDAQHSCEADGGHLLIINSELEADLVREFFASTPTFKNHSVTAVALGFHDRYKEGEYVTVLGTPLANTGYLQWLSGHPDKTYNCGACDRTAKLAIWSCTHKYAYICELGH